MGSCFSELNLRPKTAASSQSTVVGDEGPLTSPGKIDGVQKEQLPQRSTGLPNESNDKLIDWLGGHLDHPYPSEVEKEDLARQTGLDINQVSRWFLEARADLLLPMLDARGNNVTKAPPSVQSSISTVLTSTEPTYPLPFGKPVLAHFLHDPSYHNLNHASFGTVPSYISKQLHHYQTRHERAPDPFIRYTYPALLDHNRAAIAKLINAPNLNEVVFVANATVGVNTVLRGLAEHWNKDGNDEILFFSTIYGACGRTVNYVSDSTHGLVNGRDIPLTYPISDAAILAHFRAAVDTARTQGKRPRVAIFDAVSSLPGVRFPYEAMVAACRELGILSLVDAAQGVGMIPLDMAKLDPDFLVSNCHKWLHVPRACAVFYVPTRNQHLVRSTVPTSHGYVPLDPSKARANPLPPSKKSVFVNNFEYVGTLDNSPYLCVQDAIEWRRTVLGGEERIMKYLKDLARSGGEEVAHALGTWVMRNEENTLGDCGMVNVAMPLIVAQDEAGAKPVSEGEGSRAGAADVEDAAPVNALEAEQGAGQSSSAADDSVREGDITIPHSEAERIWEWMTKVLVEDYSTFIPLYYHDGRFWARLSAQVYLDGDDFVWAGKTLKILCERVAKKDYNP